MSEPTTLFVVGKREGGKRLDRFLHERIPGLSRTRIQRAIRERVRLSWGARARPSTPVRPGGQVRIGYTPLPETLLELELKILARGPGWLAVDKPSGIPVHPVNTVRENSLIRILRRQEGREALRLAHRLDRETTGVLLVAEDGPSASRMARAFMHGEVRKEYVALVRGVVEADAGRVDLPIGAASDSAVFVRVETGHGRPALTVWRVESRFADRTLLRLFPETGRRHQLRVHLEAIGHPILGDILYGRPDRDYLDLVSGAGDVRLTEGGPRRQLLHCARIVCPAPAGDGVVDVTAPLPPDFGIDPDRSGGPLASRAARCHNGTKEEETGMAPHDIEKIIERQAKFWEVRHRAAIEGGEEARRELVHLSEGPWISVSKQWGSGGEELARRIADELGWQPFDREILTSVAQNAPMMQTVLSRLDEHAIGAFNDYMTQLLVPHDPGQITFLREITRVIWGLARQGRAVILGRGANWILKPQYGLRLRVVAPLEERVARVADTEGLSIADAERQVRSHDAEQTAFIRQVFDRDINDSLGYDLVLNLGSLDPEHAVHIAIAAMRRKLESEG